MRFPQPLIEGRLVRRYKRFLADIELPDGSEVVAHCPNTGSMMACKAPGSRVWLSPSTNPKRKLRYTWELVEVEGGALACINTARPNELVGEALAAAAIGPLSGYATRRAEVRYGAEKSRIDWWLSDHDGGRPNAWVEVKNVTLGEAGMGYFPDAVTARGQKHLRELMACVAAGERAVVLFCVSHTGVAAVRPADGIDPEYGRLLREAHQAGVECLAWQADLGPHGMQLVRPLPVLLEESGGQRTG